MSNISLCILLSLLIVHVTSAKKKFNFTDMVDTTILFLDKCKPQEIIGEETILLGGEYSDFLKPSLFNIKPLALIADSKYSALDDFAKTKYSYYQYQNYRFIHFLRKVQRFLLVTSSQPLLRSLLQRIKDSPWANADGYYILIDRETMNRGCINARSYLWAAWEYNLLSVIFMCLDPDDGMVFYIFNPFSSHMGDNWHQVSVFKGRDGHPWTMFKKKITRNEDICEDLDFDKTASLNGYVIRLNAIEMEPFLSIDFNTKGLNRYTGENSEVIKLLFHKLKASLFIEIYEGNSYDLGGIGPNGTLTGMLTALADGKVDMGMNTRSLFMLWKLRYTYPHTRSGICVISQPNQKISEFTKLITFMEPPVLAGILIICLITYAIFTKNEGYVSSVLEVIRLLLCVAISHPPRIDSARIFLCMVFILFLNINSMFQSRWSSLLTVPVFYRTVDTLESIKKYGYKLYGSSFQKSLLNDDILESRYITVDSSETCEEFVQNSTGVLCVGDCHNIYYRIRNEDLYKSRTLRDITLTFVTREDWPLYTRVSSAIQQMVQCGLIRKFRMDDIRKLRRAKRRREARKKGYRVMLLSQLAFSFYILGFGYSCATVIFIVEVLLDRFNRNRSAKERKKNSRNGYGNCGDTSLGLKLPRLRTLNLDSRRS